MSRLRLMPEADAIVEIAPASNLLAQVEEAYRAGKYLWACNLAQELGPLESWTGARALCLAARLADNLGAPQRGRRLSLLAFRRYRSDPAVWPDYLITVDEMRGPLSAWQRMQRLPKTVSADSHAWSDLFAFRARLAAQMKDFIEARRWLAEAELRSPGRAWVAVERAGVLELEERSSEALAAAREALTRDPRCRPAYQIAARLLQKLDRKSEALELLESASAFIESGSVAAQLGMLQMELGQNEEADETFSRCAALWPLAEPETTQWLLSRRADAACLGRRYDFALLFSQRVDAPFYQELAARLEAGRITPRRVVLPVDSGRSCHLAGAAATLTAISRFWHKPAERLEAVGVSSGDQPLAWNERRWMEENGWAAREFRVTWDAAVGLIDRGVPFALDSVTDEAIELLAVVGYDDIRQTLLARKPGSGSIEEWSAAKLRDSATGGPRGLAFVPREQGRLLDGLDLAEVGLYERMHELVMALQRHERRKAIEWLAELRQIAPSHRLTFEARWLLAQYDGNATERLAATADWLSFQPDDLRVQVERLDLMRERSPRATRLKLVLELGGARKAPLRLQLALAEELSRDARQDAAASGLLLRACRHGPCAGRAAYLLGQTLWRRGEFAMALDLFRWAAALEEVSAEPAKTYFIAAMHFGKTQDALAFLSERFRRVGSRSNLPAKALFYAHEHLYQLPAAFLVLDSALEQRPHDAALLQFAVEVCERLGEHQRAQSLLAKAEGRVPSSAFNRLRASVAHAAGHSSRALEIWREVLVTEPIAPDANTAVVQLLAETDSPSAGARHLRLVCARFPNHLGLHESWLEAMRHDPARDVVPVIQRILDIAPANAPALRALALNLSEQRDFNAAIESALKAVAAEPDDPESHTMLAVVLERDGRREKSDESARTAIQLSVAHRPAVEHLLTLAGSLDEKKGVLAFVEAELIRQSDCGDSVTDFRILAHGILEPEELLTVLQRVHSARPGLWQAWTSVIQQLLDTKRFAEALSLAREATERFPLVAEVWLQRARACRAKPDLAAETEALEHALRVNPFDGSAADPLASAYERAGKRDRAGEVLEAACTRARFNPQTHLHLATWLWNSAQREAAIRRVRTLLSVEPLHDASWIVFQEWSQAMDDPRLPTRFALELTELRPGDARNWLALSKRRFVDGNLPEALAAAERAVRLHPRFVEAGDFRAQLFVALKNRDAALEACLAPVWGGYPPVALRARAAWVEAELNSLAVGVKSIRDLLAVHSEFAWGWNLLADWSARLGELDAAIHAASQMARLDPLGVTPLAYRASLRMQRNDRTGAKADLRQALNLVPSDERAAGILFDLCLADGEFDAAEQLLVQIKQHVGGYLPAACETRLRAERSRKTVVGAPAAQIVDPAQRAEESQRALENFRELCLARLEDAQPLEAAFKSLQRSRLDMQADALVEEMLRSPEASPFLGALWVRRRVIRKGTVPRDELNALVARGEIGRQAIIACVGELAARSDPERLRQVIKEHRLWLTMDPRGWEAVGLALYTLALRDDFLAWTADWQKRASLGPELRLALVRSLREAQRDAEADEAARGAANDASRNTAVHRLRVWVAAEAAIAGESERGRMAIESVDPVLLDDYHRQVRRLARALLEVQGAPPESRGLASKSAIERVERAARDAKLKKTDVAMRRIFRRLVNQLSRECGRPGLRLWAWRQL